MAKIEKKENGVFKSNLLIFYNLSLYLSGLFLVHKKALSLIELKNQNIFLDIGCGSGKLIFELDKIYKNKNLYGIDPSPKMIDLATTKSNKFKHRNDIHFKIAFGQDLPFVPDSVDFINSTLAFHHINIEDKIKVLREITRILKPGGLCLISDLGDRPRRILGHIFYLISSKHAFIKGNLQVIENELKDLGFQKIKTERNFGYIEHLLWKKPSY